MATLFDVVVSCRRLAEREMRRRLVTLLLGLALGMLLGNTSQAYLKIDDPPDVDKPDRNGDGLWPDAGDNSCWLASAANMLAGAGYGDAATIYGTLTDHFGFANPGFAGTALRWYLQNHPVAGNLYTVVTEYDHGSFWDSHWTPAFIAAELRRCQFVGINIYDSADMTGGAHALTVWGDDGNAEAPSWCWVTDSDRDMGALDIDSYNWTRHPDLAGQGKDLYSLDYWTGAGYLGYVVTLCPVPEPAGIVVFSLMLATALTGYRLRRRSR